MYVHVHVQCIYEKCVCTYMCVITISKKEVIYLKEVWGSKGKECCNYITISKIK